MRIDLPLAGRSTEKVPYAGRIAITRFVGDLMLVVRRKTDQHSYCLISISSELCNAMYVIRCSSVDVYELSTIINCGGRQPWQAATTILSGVVRWDLHVCLCVTFRELAFSLARMA